MMESDGMGDDDDLKWRFKVEALTHTHRDHTQPWLAILRADHPDLNHDRGCAQMKPKKSVGENFA